VKHNAGMATSLGAIGSALASVACCLPFGAAAAIGIAGASVFLDAARPWLAATSVLLVAAGFWQQRRASRCGIRTGRLSVLLLWCSLVVVVAVIFFPQEIAGLLADLPAAGRPR